MRLRLRVGPKYGEDVVGLALRLTQRSGYTDLKSFMRAFGVRLDTESFDSGLKRVADLADLSVEPLLEWSLKPVTPSLLLFRSQKLPNQSGLLTKCRRFCPACIQDDFANARSDEPDTSIPFIRSWWRTTLIYGCPVHNVAMLNLCPACHQQISDLHLPLHQCHCGHDLRDSETVDLTAGDLIANDYFLGRLSMAEPMACPMLDSISIFEVANVLRRLGAAAILGKRENIKVAVGKLDKDLAGDQAPINFGKLLNAGFEYARDGSPSLRRLLEKMVEGKGRLYAGPAEMFGSKFRSWAVHRDNPIREALLEIWNPFISEYCLPTRRIAESNGLRPRHLAGKPQLLHPLEKERLARVLGHTLPDEMPRKDAYAFGKSKGLITSKEGLLENLGWNLNHPIRFNLSALVTPAWYSDVPHAQPYYVHDAAAFFENLATRSLGFAPSQEVVSLMNSINKGGVNVAPILLSRILRGDIPLFNSQAGAFLKSYTIPADAAPKREVLNADGIDAAWILGVDIETVSQLIFHGHLKKGTDGSGASIDIQSLDKLSRTLVTATRIGNICSSGMQTDTIEKLLVNAGVRSALPPQCKMIFSREAAIRAFYENWDWNLEPPRADCKNSLVTRIA